MVVWSPTLYLGRKHIGIPYNSFHLMTIKRGYDIVAFGFAPGLVCGMKPEILQMTDSVFCRSQI
jgi:hypothetical protein